MDAHKPSPKSVDSALKMIDVGEKQITRRRALAFGSIRMSRSSVEKIMERSIPKGDVLTLAEAAGIMAAKRTPEILPLCHTLLLDSIRIQCNPKILDAEFGLVEVSCEVLCHGKTGVEMEALTGVSAAVLCIYDLVKGIDPALTIENIFLDVKEGGKTGTWTHPKKFQEKLRADFSGIRVCTLTVSDRATKDATYDKTGPMLVDYFKTSGATILEYEIVPDDIRVIQDKVLLWSKELRADVIVLTGGTGIGPRDVTPEALEKIWTKKLPGFGEMFRAKGMLKTEHAWLSRAEAGLIDQTYVALLPGSTGAVKDGLDIFEKTMMHALQMVRGEKH